MAGRYMTDGEIITSYRQAKSPARQKGKDYGKNGENLIPLDRLEKFAAICTKIAQMADEPIKLRFDATGKGASMCLSWGTKEIYFSEEWKDESEDTGTQSADTTAARSGESRQAVH